MMDRGEGSPQRWTPVTEELPDVGPAIGAYSRHVLLGEPTCPVAVGVFIRFGMEWGEHQTTDTIAALMPVRPGDTTSVFATHWRDLPPPPRSTIP